MEETWTTKFSNVKNEADFHQDILLWKGQTNRHLASLSWLKQHMSVDSLNQTLTVVSQDDMFVEIIHFSQFITAVYGNSIAPDSMICDVISSGTVRVRPDIQIMRSEQNYSPDYCHQAGVILSPDLVDKLLQASGRKVK